MAWREERAEMDQAAEKAGADKGEAAAALDRVQEIFGR